MTNILGIDHPLVGVRDIGRAKVDYESLGFRIKGIGKHPWGTSTCAILFRNSILELMGIYDESLIDSHPAGTFRFGRHIRDAIAEREGIALTALYSDDADRDVQIVESRGGHCEGTIEFGRDVTIKDGSPARTKTTLKILPCDAYPRLSNFACQQHRRDLIEYPEWMDHPNTAFGFASIAILAEKEQQDAVADHLAKMHGRGNVRRDTGVLTAATGNGEFLVLDRADAQARYGDLPEAITAPTDPYEFALDLKVHSTGAVMGHVKAAGAANRVVEDRIVLPDANRLGGVILSFAQVY